MTRITLSLISNVTAAMATPAGTTVLGLGVATFVTTVAAVIDAAPGV